MPRVRQQLVGSDGDLSSRQVTSRRWSENVCANEPMISRFGGAEGDRTPDLLSAIHLTEICGGPRGTVGEIGITRWLPSPLVLSVK